MNDETQSEATPDVTPIHLYRRTWELELLISGAIVVTLFQLPGVADDIFRGLQAHVSHELFKVIWTIYYPFKLAINPAIVVFVIHILLRGFWVGMVGLNAVFPNGIAWTKVNLPPIALAFSAPRTDPKKLEQKVDRAASLLFAVLFSLLALTAALAFWLTTGMAAVVVIASLPSTTTSISTIFRIVYVGIFIVLMTPGVAAGIIDRSCERWPGLARRFPFLITLCRALLLIGSVVMLVRLWYPATVTIASNLSKRKPETWRVIALTVPTSVLLSSLVLISVLAGPLYDSVDSYIYAPPRPQESGMQSMCYRSLRTADMAADVPTIQSDMINEPYLKLFLPYDAWRDNERLAEHCPGTKPFRRDGDLLSSFLRPATTAENRQAVLACFTKIWTVALNGNPLELELLFTDNPETGGRGLAAYIPIDSLPRGKNELVVRRQTTIKERERRRFNAEKHVFYIPFWI